MPTDEQITRALAEMAGLPLKGSTYSRKNLVYWVEGHPLVFSPLTDWRDLGPLMAQEGLWLSPAKEGNWKGWVAKKWGVDGSIASADNPLRAACLALYFAREQKHGR